MEICRDTDRYSKGWRGGAVSITHTLIIHAWCESVRYSVGSLRHNLRTLHLKTVITVIQA